jgi:hypothetical protein
MRGLTGLSAPIPLRVAVAAMTGALAAALVCGASPGIASIAGGPAAKYRAHLNAVCRGYSPKFRATEDAIAAAQSEQNRGVYFSSYGRFFSLIIAENASIESTVTPPAMKTLMAQPVALLKAIDPALRSGLSAAQQKASTGLVDAVTKANAASAAINRALDAAGLRDCGSNQ